MTPEAGAVDVQDGTAEIRVRFSKKMMAGSWSVVKVDDDSFAKIIGKPRFEADGKTFVLPIQLQSKRTYVLWLNTKGCQGFKDASGRSAVPYLLMSKVK